jgi:hypothetical protein
MFFVRDKAKREVDFLLTRNAKPWKLVEAESNPRFLEPSLAYFHKCLGTEHAFQVGFDMDYVDRDTLSARSPARVLAATLLYQLVWCERLPQTHLNFQMHSISPNLSCEDLSASAGLVRRSPLLQTPGRQSGHRDARRHNRSLSSSAGRRVAMRRGI